MQNSTIVNIDFFTTYLQYYLLFVSYIFRLLLQLLTCHLNHASHQCCLFSGSIITSAKSASKIFEILMNFVIPLSPLPLSFEHEYYILENHKEFSFFFQTPNFLSITERSEAWHRLNNFCLFLGGGQELNYDMWNLTTLFLDDLYGAKNLVYLDIQNQRHDTSLTGVKGT